MEEKLNTVGFSNINSKRKLNKILQDVMNTPNLRYIIGKDSEDMFIEYIKYFGNGIGIAVRGSIDEDDKVIVNSWAPYVETSNKTEITEADIDINGKREYIAVCKEEQTGNEIEFYLQNVVDFLNVEEDDDASIAGAYIVGLAIEGTIIFPIKKESKIPNLGINEDELYESLMRLMLDGCDEDEQILQSRQNEMTETITERLDKEDLFSVIESYFSSDSEQELIYNVLGTINRVDKIRNKLTHETMYKLNLSTMGIKIDVCINKNKLVGFPIVGMRFKGKCWIQGKLVFE